MAAKVFWLALALAVLFQQAQAQSVRPDPKQDAGQAARTSGAAKQKSNDDPLPAGAIARLGTTRFRPTRESHGVSILPGGHTLVLSTSDGYLEYWDAYSGRFLRDVLVTKPYVHSAAHTPNGRLVVLRGSYIDEEQRKSIQWVALFDAENGAERMRLENEDRRIERMALSADGSTIAIDGEKIRVIDTAAKAEVLNLDSARQQIGALTLSHDGQTLAFATNDGIQIWNWAAGGEPRTVLTPRDARQRLRILSMEFSPDGGELAVSGDGRGDGQRGVLIMDVATGKEIRRLNVDGVRFWYPRSLAWSHDGRLLAAPIESQAGGGIAGGAAIWNVASGELMHRVKGAHETVTNLSFSADGQLLAGASYHHRQLCVWNVSTGERYGANLPGHAYAPSSIRFFPDEDRLASASDDATIRLWDVNQAEETKILQHERDPTDGTRWVRAMDVSPNGKYIASSSLDDTVRVWEADTGKELYRLPGHGRLGGRRSVRFTPDSQRLVSWGDDMRVYVWDVATGKAVHEFRAQPGGVKLPAEGEVADPFGGREGLFHLEGGMTSPDASRLLVLGGNSHVFDITKGKEIAKFERTVGVNIGQAISPDNQYTIALSWGRGRQIQLQGGGAHFSAAKNHLVHLRNLSDGKLVAEMALPGGGIGEAAFSPDSHRVAITIDDDKPRVLILSVPELKEIARIDGLRGRANAIEFPRSGKRLAVSDADTTVLVYDLDKLPKE